MEILFPFWSCPKICNQNVKRVNWIMKFPGCNFTEKGRIAKPGYHFTDYRALWYNRTFDHQHIVQDNTIQETLANWWQMIFQTIFYTIWMVNVRCNLTHGQNCLVAMFSNLRIYLKFCRHQIKYLMIIGGRVDLNNLQRIQRDQISVNIVCRRRDEKWKDIYKCCWIWQTCLWDWRWFRSRTRLTKLSLIIWGNIENAVYLKGVGRFLMVDYEKERRGSLARDQLIGDRCEYKLTSKVQPFYFGLPSVLSELSLWSSFISVFVGKVDNTSSSKKCHKSWFSHSV